MHRGQERTLSSASKASWPQNLGQGARCCAYTFYVLEAPVKCPFCPFDILEKTVIEPRLRTSSAENHNGRRLYRPPANFLVRPQEDTRGHQTDGSFPGHSRRFV